LGDVITPAIRSRSFPISFNAEITDIPDIIKRISKKYPKLDTEIINNCVPDMRQIQQYVAML